MRQIDNFKRHELFQRYNNMQNPFIIMTVSVRVTNLVNYSKVHKHFYAMFGYLIGKAVNEVKEFRYRYVDSKYFLCDKVGVSYTEKTDDEIVFFDCFEEDREKFVSEYDKKKEQVLLLNKSIAEEREDVIWISCEPWFNFSSLVAPFDKSITIPQFIWDRYVEKDGEYYCNLMIMVHHGFADGQHIGEFLRILDEEINNLK